MKRHELLVPAGNMDCLRQAVYNGCDAVYLACKSFGARKFANNFDNEEIIEALKFCHLYGVRVYVTMNTLVKNNEVESFIDQARFLHNNGVDALIVQDFGMICLLREKFPNLEIHASTQANISSKEVCKLYYDLGVKRVVFSRELSIDEIDSIDVPIEKEAFIHGALCISYSGCCLMSSMLGGRSGNRGECAGCCRLPYTLEKNNNIVSKNKYLLSTKELNTSSKIDRLLDSSIYSFKIEGRMKSPLYVGFITNFYRHLIDKKGFDLEKETDRLKTIFNREFTVGRMFSEDDYNFMNIESPNHKGLNIGEVIDITKDKIRIKLYDGCVLNQQDAIRFVGEDKGFIVNYLYDERDNLINSSTGICLVDNKVDLKGKCIVSKTQDFKLEEEYSRLENKRKVNISIKVKAFSGKELFIEFGDGNNTVSRNGNIVQEARNAGVSIDDIKRQLSKLGNTPFTCDDFDIEMDNNIFIPIGELNEIRRELSDKLIEKRQLIETEIIENDVTFEKDDRDVSYDKCFVVRNRKQLEKCLEHSFKIYVIDRNLYEEYKDNSNIYYYVPREVFNIKNSLVEKNLVSDYSKYTGDIIGNYTLNVFNIYTAYYLKKIGINRMCLSVELSEDELFEFITLYNKTFGKSNFDILVYGRVENMIIKGNILNIESGYNNYSLVDFKDRKFPVYYDGVNTHILNYEDKNIDINRFTDLCNFRYDLYDEDIDKVLEMC